MTSLPTGARSKKGDQGTDDKEGSPLLEGGFINGSKQGGGEFRRKLGGHK